MLFSLFVLIGCSQKKLSPEELISSLQSAGYKATMEKSIHHSIEGAEIAFWVNIDGNMVSAFCFDTVEKAKLKKLKFKNGLNFGYWAFEYVDPITREKLTKALKK
jgi:recombinational DNA repair protein RecR